MPGSSLTDKHINDSAGTPVTAIYLCWQITVQSVSVQGLATNYQKVNSLFRSFAIAVCVAILLKQNFRMNIFKADNMRSHLHSRFKQSVMTSFPCLQ